MTEFLDNRVQESETIGYDQYYNSNNTSNQSEEQLKNDCSEISTFQVKSLEFAQKHPEFCIEGYTETDDHRITITEYAPKIFRKIRQGRLSEKQLM